ncbi:MAG: DUF72 domain-containing protein [Chitinivibrionales bacterium]|nr:DUF72 domain-containing protein [Chitinivibrionales bacterium]
MSDKRGTVRIGTSGWNYNHWKGPFYPAKIRAHDMLPFYLEHFRTVEVNNSFYHLPSREVFEQWRNTAPERFVFSVKASRYITHMKKLKDPHQGLSRFMKAAGGLETKLGVVLFQLPPRWSFDEQRLSAFLEALPDEHSYAFEMRDHSWHCERAYELLRLHGCSFCIYDLAGFTSPIITTSDTVYVRLHGPDGAYAGSYSPQALRAWANRFAGWAAEGRNVYCYFDNDQEGYATQDARRIRRFVEGDIET